MKKDWGGLTLADALDETVNRFPDKEAIVFNDRRITFRELKEKINKLAKAFLKLGLKREDKIAIMMGNCPEWVYARDAAIRIGALWVPINTRYKLPELEYILRHSDATTLVMVDEFLQINFIEMINKLCPELSRCEPGRLASEKLPLLKNVICLSEKKYDGMFNFNEFLEYGSDVPDDELKEARSSIQPDDTVNITYTSGTTGAPKGVMTSHSQFLKAMAAMAERFGTTEDDHILLPAPLFTNIGNLTGLIQGEMYGAPLVMLEYFNTPEVLRAIKEERCSIFTGPPAMYTMMIEHEDFKKRDVSSMRTGIIGGAPVTPEIVGRIAEEIGMKIFSAYGMTENSAITTMSEVDDSFEMIANTSGRLLFKDCEMKIVDPKTGKDLPQGKEGEIWTRGWLVMKGYYKMPEETAKSIDKEGWFHTGDLGIMDQGGYLKVTGRLKDLIISGGFNIDPVEVGSLISQHPSVEMAQVIGVPDRRLGEVAMAFVKLKEGKECKEDDIIDFCMDRIGKYKVPKYVKFIEEFPVTAYGKVQKFKLKDMAIKELGLK